MTKKKYFMIFFILFSFINVYSINAQGELNGLMFGDYYYIFSHNNSSLKGQNGFWFKRIYFTYDYKISERWSTRFRLEMNSPGDFKTKDTLKPFVKDAYLQWKRGNQNIILGISPTPTWEYVESFWGYRSVEKTPVDLYKMGDSRDFGVALRGSLGKRGLFSYHLMFGNGEGVRSEVNKEKRFMGSFLIKPFKCISFELYGDYAQGASHTNYWTYQGLLGCRWERGRIGIQYVHQVKQQGWEKNDLKIDVLSVLGAYNVYRKVTFFFRYDRMYKPLPVASTINYVPMNENAPFHMGIVGVDLKISESISFIPNVMAVLYDEYNNFRPKNDIYLRVTFFYSF